MGCPSRNAGSRVHRVWAAVWQSDRRLLLAGNAIHADIPLDASGSGFLGLLLIMLGQTVGFPVPERGVGKLAEAMRDRFLRYGG